eukprot:2784073-Rhodomonas_salina.2
MPHAARPFTRAPSNRATLTVSPARPADRWSTSSTVHAHERLRGIATCIATRKASADGHWNTVVGASESTLPSTRSMLSTSVSATSESIDGPARTRSIGSGISSRRSRSGSERSLRPTKCEAGPRERSSWTEASWRDASEWTVTAVMRG